MGEITKVNTYSKNPYISLRTTVPKNIAKVLKIKVGDNIKWEFDGEKVYITKV